MGSAKATLILCIAFVVNASIALGDPCEGTTGSGEKFPTCFDLGNRVFLSGGSGGFGGGVRLRQALGFDDEPDLTWKLEHRAFEAQHEGLRQTYSGVLYSGRYLRHARDGHLVLPLGKPRKIFVPFDIGAEAELGRVEKQANNTGLNLGVIRIAGLFDFSRSPTFRRRLTLGAIATWDMRIDTRETLISVHRIAPFSLVGLNGHLESRNGLTVANIELSGGRTWSNQAGWQWQAKAHLSLERILLALNDRPLSVVLDAKARHQEEAEGDLRATLSARFALFSIQ